MKIFDIKKKFGEFLLDVKEMDLSKEKIYGIAGSNGSGKTTVMKIMAGLIKPDSGIVDYCGLSQGDITMVFRKPYLINSSVEKNLIYPLEIRKIKPDESRVEFFLKLAGLQDMRKKHAKELSGGQQQKLALVRAFIFLPKLVFIDEGFSNLDTKSLDLFEEFILGQNDMRFVICSHQMDFVR